MSHFSVLVITREGETVEQALAPYHEFECTGTNDEYVQNFDKTAEAREKYETATATTIVQRPDGTKFYPFNEQGNWCDEIKPFIKDQRLELPAGWKKLDKEPAKDWGTFEDWCVSEYGGAILEGLGEPDLEEAHKFGWIRVVEGEVTEVVDRTNPNAHWDWYQIGGRWAGAFLPKPGATGRKGQKSWTNRDETIVGVDILRKGDIDWAAMKATKVAERRKWIHEIVSKSGLAQDAVEKGIHALEEAYTRWLDLPEPKPRGPQYREWLQTIVSAEAITVDKASPWSKPDLNGKSIDDWCEAAPAFSAFACISGGNWYQKGDMGWFGVVRDEKDQRDWLTELNSHIQACPDDALFTLVDCHT